MMLVEKGDREAVECLLDNRADPSMANKQGKTALMRATRQGRLIIAALLVKHGADIEAEDSFGKTALDIARANQLTEMAKFLKKPRWEEVLGGAASIALDEPFMISLTDPAMLGRLFGVEHPLKTKARVLSRGREGNLTISPSVMSNTFFGCTVVVKLSESPAHAERYLQAVEKQYGELMQYPALDAPRLGDGAIAFRQNEGSAVLFFTLQHVFVQVTLMAPVGEHDKIGEIGKHVLRRLESG
jgi:hypothetical protein